MTMEEATELFTIMDAMIRASEAARVAMSRAPAIAAVPPAIAPPRPTAPVPASAGMGDEFFLFGLMAMGAGAGLLAAMAQRMQAPPTSPTPPAKGSATSGRSA